MRVHQNAVPLVLIGLTLGGCIFGPMATDEEQDPPVAIDVAPTSLTLDVGEVAHLEATVTNATDPGVSWSSSNQNIATVDTGGAVTAVSPGIATITATSVEDPNAVDAAAVSVNGLAAEISPTGIALQPGESAVFACTLRSTGTGEAIAGHTFTWSSSDPLVAEVDAGGTVTAVSLGTVNVACDVTVGGVELGASATVIVTVPIVGACADFDLSLYGLASDTIPVVPGLAGQVDVLVENRAAGFTGAVELMLTGRARGPDPNDVLSAMSFAPNPVVYLNGDVEYSTLSFTPRTDVSAGETYDLAIVGASPFLEMVPPEDWCRIPVTFEVVGQ